jgi:hypothetical protein
VLYQIAGLGQCFGQLGAHGSCLLGVYAACDATDDGLDWVDELATCQCDQVSASFSYLKRETGGVSVPLSGALISVNLKNAIQAEAIGHGEDKEGSCLILDELP